MFILNLRIGQFDRYDMCIDTFWSISDISDDTFHMTMLLKRGILIENTISHNYMKLYEPYWGCAAPKGHFWGPDSLVKGVFFLPKS